jgi:hypothetical protein
VLERSYVFHDRFLLIEFRVAVFSASEAIFAVKHDQCGPGQFGEDAARMFKKQSLVLGGCRTGGFQGRKGFGERHRRHLRNRNLWRKDLRSIPKVFLIDAYEVS